MQTVIFYSENFGKVCSSIAMIFISLSLLNISIEAYIHWKNMYLPNPDVFWLLPSAGILKQEAAAENFVE